MKRHDADLVVTAEGFPHGIRCSICDEIIENGQRYSEILDGFIRDTPLVLLVCMSCATEGLRT